MKAMNPLRLYKNISVTAKASLWFMFCTLIQKCLALITTPIFTRIMNTEQFGIYSTYLSVGAILTVIFTLNFDTCAYMNGISKFSSDKEKDEIACSLLSLTALLSIGFSLLFLINRNFVSSFLALPPELILLMLAEILFIPPLKFWMVKQRFAYKYISVVVVTIGMLLFNTLLGIVFVMYSSENQAVYRGLSIVIVQMVVGLVLYVYYFRKVGPFRLTKYWKNGLKLNLPLLPHSLSIVLLSSVGRVMINSMIGATQAGIYGIGHSAGLMINAMKLSLVDAIRPWIYERLKEHGEQSIRRIRETCNFLFMLNILFTFLIIGLAPEIVRILAPAAFYEAIYVIPPIAVSSYFTFIYNICSIVEIYYEKTKWVMIASLVAAATNLVLNYLFIPVYGYLAAGYTILISYIVLSVMHYIFLREICKKELNGEKIIELKTVLPTSILVLGLMGLFLIIYAHTIIRYCVVLAIVTVCILMRKRIFNTISIMRRDKEYE